MTFTFSKQALYACKWSRHSHQIQVNNKAKHVGCLNTAPVSWKYTGYQPGLCRGPTPPCRGVVPMASFKNKVGKNLGFPLKNMKNMMNMIMMKNECKIITCYKSLRFHAMSSKHGRWYPYKKIMQEPTQKHGLCSKLSDQNETFFKNTWKPFSLSKTNFNSMHDMQNNSIMQCS